MYRKTSRILPRFRDAERQTECAPNFPAGKAQQTRVINDARGDFSWEPTSLSCYSALSWQVCMPSRSVNRRSVCKIFSQMSNARNFEIHSLLRLGVLHNGTEEKKETRRGAGVAIYRAAAKGFISRRWIYYRGGGRV